MDGRQRTTAQGTTTAKITGKKEGKTKRVDFKTLGEGDRGIKTESGVTFRVK